MQSIQLPSRPPKSPHPVLNLGFRVFFLGAACCASLTMMMWLYILHLSDGAALTSQMSLPFWHAHEMIFGYACAVVAGFLLTAVKTWTSQPMPYGWRLLMIFLPWGLARIFWMVDLPFAGSFFGARMILVCGLDLLFWALTSFFVIAPIVRVRQKRQSGIVAKIVLLFLAQAGFYAGVFLRDANWQRVGLYLGLYLIIGVVLTIGRRVIPFFIDRGVDETAHIKNFDWVDKLSLVSFLAFTLVAVFFPKPILLSLTAGSVAVINLVRLAGWHTKGIWKKPLLWSLYLAFLGMCLGFVLFALQPWFGFAQSLALHAVSVSGIGLMTLAMMARVSLGHTGRNIHQPPNSVYAVFLLMILAWILRVVMPLIAIEQYMTWILLAQICWIASFIILIIQYTNIWIRPRTDGLFG